MNLAPALIIGLALGLAGAGPAPAAAPVVKGAVGVCLRWGASRDHVRDVVIVHPSGNPVLDAALPDSIRQMQWARPTDPKAASGWTGVWMSVDGASPPSGPPPDCSNADRLLPRPQLNTTRT